MPGPVLKSLSPEGQKLWDQIGMDNKFKILKAWNSNDNNTKRTVNMTNIKEKIVIDDDKPEKENDDNDLLINAAVSEKLDTIPSDI